MRGLVTLLVVVLLAGVGLYFFSPWFRTKVDDTVAGMQKWDAEARRKNPVGYIEYATKRLETNVEKFENVRTDLAVASAKLKDMKAKNTQKITVADTTLESLKAAYKEAKGGKGWPVKVAEGSYTEATLKSQVNSLLKEKEAFAKVAAQADAGLVKAERSSLEIQNRITESKMQISILATQKELVKMNQLTAESEKLLAQVNDVILENEAAAQRPAVRTVEELMRDTDASTGAASPDVDAFLNG
jgi:phage shock protein A